MKWNHLPVAGGLYDQHPTFVDDMLELMTIDNEMQEKHQKEQEAKQKRSGTGTMGRGRRRR